VPSGLRRSPVVGQEFAVECDDDAIAGGCGFFSKVMLKLMALMMPSPNCS
jgi:hypothetical protein